MQNLCHHPIFTEETAVKPQSRMVNIDYFKHVAEDTKGVWLLFISYVLNNISSKTGHTVLILT